MKTQKSQSAGWYYGLQIMEAERHPAEAGGAGVEGLFQSLLALSFIEGVREAFL